MFAPNAQPQAKPKTSPGVRARLFAMTAFGILFAAASAHASVSDDLESLGGNDATVKRAGQLSSSQTSAIVQGRTVDRNLRLEVDGNYSPLASGNSYLNTQMAGVRADFHVVPQFSLGVRYEQAFNQLTNEGQSAYNTARTQSAAGGNYTIPDIDYPKYSVMGTASWYMFYGKLNFFDLRVVQFDIYSIFGYGQMTTQYDVSPEWTAGGGIAFWLTQHFTSRFELRYETYNDHPYTGERTLNLIVVEFALGVLI